MPRLNSAKDFKGNSYVTTKSFNLPSGITKLFDEATNKIATSLLTIPAESYTAVVTQTNAGLSGFGTTASPLAVDLSSYTAGESGSTIESVALKAGNITLGAESVITLGTAGFNAANGLVKLDANAKIATSMLPDLAITDVYTLAVTADNYTANTTTVVDLVKLAVTTGVQKGDVVILTAEDKTIAEAVAGTYIFVVDVADKANIEENNYKKMYAPAGTVTTVNSIAPVAGNVTLNIADIGNITGITTIATANGVTSVNGTALAKDADLTTLTGIVGKGSTGSIETDDFVAATGIFARLETIEGQLGTGTGTNSVSERLDALEKGLATEKLHRYEDDVVLKTAVEKAVEVEEVEKTLSTYTTGTKEEANQVVTINNMTSGVIVAVLNANGEQVYPTITYKNGVATLVADYEDGDVDASWKIYKTKAITATLTHTVVANDGE